MEHQAIENNITIKESNFKETPIEMSVFDDDVIMDLAKRRLSIKNNLVSQAIDFILIGITMFILVSLYHTDSKLVIASVFCTFWGLRFLIRVFKFAKPSFRDGIAAYLKERQNQKIESEYNRLKKMSAEYVASELNK